MSVLLCILDEDDEAPISYFIPRDPPWKDQSLSQRRQDYLDDESQVSIDKHNKTPEE